MKGGVGRGGSQCSHQQYGELREELTGSSEVSVKISPTHAISHALMEVLLMFG